MGDEDAWIRAKSWSMVEDLGHPRNAQHRIPARDKDRRAAMQREQKACLFSLQTQQENVAFAEREFGKFPLQEEIFLLKNSKK